MSYSDGKPTYGPLKTPGRNKTTHEEEEKRIIPHWLDVTPNQAYEWIEAGLKTLMHPDTLTHRWRTLMLKLGMAYEIHELMHPGLPEPEVLTLPVKSN